jgi:DNA ligase-1
MASPRWLPLIIACLGALSLSSALAGDKPGIMLAEIYQQGIDVSQYWVSEKLDGVRARWDGKQLLSRGGHVFTTPAWFTKDFPAIPLDGELWVGRERFEETASIVRKQQPHEGWRTVRLMVFDLPEHGGTFDERVFAMKHLGTQVHSPHLTIIEQESFASEDALRQGLQAAIAQGGYRPGKGKFSGHVGSLKVRTDQGIVFFIGTGLSDAQRSAPPPLQSRITFRYQGFTKNGIPRFPVFLRIRDEQPE